MKKKYRIRRIDLTDTTGKKEYRAVCIEVNDIESYRMKMKSQGYSDVSFVYEETGEQK